MGKLCLSLAGAIAGLMLAYLNRPTYLGGAVDPIEAGLTGSTVDRAAFEEWLPTVFTYGLIGVVIGLVLGAILDNTKNSQPR